MIKHLLWIIPILIFLISLLIPSPNPQMVLETEAELGTDAYIEESVNNLSAYLILFMISVAITTAFATFTGLVKQFV